ncbi:glycosyltransferase family 4 protein [uncultured Hyphomonas sp.]|uniref:glycosyltransferase family 4 protein n=1 Tax=uncultured Hyphomonas sp. TaxID=225298 RepID=UPI002AAC22B8|nr:glycosyltransferase family 4 protein [uncultured Hyphomonas sp.]
MKPESKKVLVITGVFPPMPIAEGDHIARLSEGLAERGYSVDVLTSTKADGKSVKGCRVHAEMDNWNWASQGKVLRFAQELKPDLIFIWFIGMAFEFHPMISLLPTRLKAALPETQIVTQITAPVGVRPKEHPFLTRLNLKISVHALGGGNISYEYGTILRDSDRVVAMAKPHLERFAEHMPGLEDKSAIIPPPPLIPMSVPGEASRLKGREMLGVPADAPLFAYFGRLYVGKGLEYLIRGFAKVRAQLPEARLAIIGGAAPDYFKSGWSVDDLHAIAREEGIEDAISWTGEFPFDTDAGSLYLRAADYAVLPFSEGAALNNSSIAACAAHELPVITTLGDRPEPEFVDGGNVLLVAPKDADALADGMRRVLKDADLSERLRAGSAALTNQYFSWDATLDSTVKVFADALETAAVQELA